MLAGMRQVHLSTIDLNLLPALAALLEERSVSRAADTVGLSQSAMSRSLSRLRRLLDDDLLVRSGAGYQLTTTAEQIRTQLGEVVPRLDAIFVRRDFDPATEAREFRLAGSDYAIATLGPAVFSSVLSAAPLSSVRFYPWHTGVLQDLVDGRLDLFLSGLYLEHPVISKRLFTEDMMCVVDPGHPLAGRTELTLDEYLSYGHIMIDVAQGLQPSIDRVLAAHGTPRRAVLTVPFHATAPAAVAGTDLILSSPARTVRQFVTPLWPTLRVLSAPPEIRPLPYSMSWHARIGHDLAHAWLREQVEAAVAAMSQ